MENETAAPEGRVSKELRNELENFREELRNGLEVVQMDLKTLIRKVEWLTSDAKNVRNDIHYFREFTIGDIGNLRRKLESLDATLHRHVYDAPSPGGSAELRERDAELDDPASDATS
jgi:uncharacterized coiled-coil DUF342 family protein